MLNLRLLYASFLRILIYVLDKFVKLFNNVLCVSSTLIFIIRDIIALTLSNRHDQYESTLFHKDVVCHVLFACLFLIANASRVVLK